LTPASAGRIVPIGPGAGRGRFAGRTQLFSEDFDMKMTSLVLAATLVFAACGESEPEPVMDDTAPAVAPEPAPVIVDTTGMMHDSMSGMTGDTAARP
jgi:hypothetical protein